MKRITTGIAAVALAAGIGIGTAATASANSQYGCSTQDGHLHATATLINYGSAKGTAVYTSATPRWLHVRTLGSDHDWRFKRMTLVNYSTKTSNPSQWGSSTSPLNWSTKYVRVTWEALGGEISTSCLVKVGV